MTVTGKSIQLVEVDLDAYRATQFELDKPYEDVSGWTKRWNTDCELVCVAAEDGLKGKVAEFRVTGSAAPYFFSMNKAPDIRDASALARFKPVTADAICGVVLRGSGDSNTPVGYQCSIKNGDTIEIVKRTSGGSSTLATASFSYAIDDTIWIRFDAINASSLGGASGVTLRGKVWVGGIDDEPSSFMIAVDDTSSTINVAGKSGLYAGDGTTQIGFYRVRSYLASTEETLRFVKPSSYLPVEIEAIPNVSEITQTPATLSLGENLGTRAQVHIVFKDHKHAEQGEFYNDGSFWARFRARNLFRRGRPIRVKTGFLDQNEANYEIRHYYLDKFDGPNQDDEFTIVAQDLLKFADNDRAQAPRANVGILTGTLASDGMSFSVVSGTGSEYSPSGYVAIGGKEIVSYTRSGDSFTITARALFGTTAIEHSAQDRVQQCIYASGLSPADILYRLFTDYADIDASTIDLTAWQTECNTYLQRQYTRLIAEPTGVAKLAEELIEQAGLILWWDNLNQQVKLQVLRGIATTTFEYNEENIIAGTIEVEEQRDKLVTEVWTYYGVRNPLDSLNEANNYRSVSALTNGEQSTLNGSPVIKKIYGTWIPAFGATTAERTNVLHAGRFNIPPRKVSFSIPRNANIRIPVEAGGYQFRYHGAQTEFGSKDVTIPIQVTKVESLPDRVNVEAEEMLFEQFDPGDLIDRVITIDSDVLNLNLRTTHDQIYPAITTETLAESPTVTLTCIINPGVTVGSNSTSIPAFQVGSWPVGFKPTIIIKGRVQGRGGDGGRLRSGHPGGTAFYTRHPIFLQDAGGQIWGGGGGGGATIYEKSAWTGGGGAGTLPGADGSGVSSPATATSGGIHPWAGDGGGPGQSGGAQAGTVGAYTGGAAGRSIDGISYITQVGSTGDRRGAQTG